MAKQQPAKGGEALRAMEVHRKKLQQLAEGRSVDRIKKMYDSAQDALEKKLKNTLPDRRGTFTAHQQRMALGQIRQGQKMIVGRVAGELVDLSRDAQVDSLRGLSGYITKLDEEYDGAARPLAIDEAAVFQKVIAKRESSLIRGIDTSFARYGSALTQKIEGALSTSILTEETTDEAIERVRETADNEFWQAERIVRTEQSYAFNATHADGLEELAQEDDGIYMRWVEHVTDEGVPMDDRVGADSIALHGQVIRPGGLFMMPDDPDVSDSLIGQGWPFPPDRPNDRAVVVAWKVKWGGMAWVYEAGDKRYLSR